MRTAPPKSGDPAGETLPAPLSGLVERVIRRTRLWPSEKRDLRAELESHFREGLIDLIEQGLEFERAVQILGEEFGDPKLAAELIRRSKKRGRPMIWKVLVNVVMVTAVGAGAAGGYFGWLLASKPNPTVDYVEKINEPVRAVPYRERAWPALAEVSLRFEPLPEGMKGTFRSEFAAVQPGSEHWAPALEWLESNRALIPAITEAAHKSAWGFVYGSEESRRLILEQARLRGEGVDEDFLRNGPGPLDPPTISILLPSLSEVRQMGRLLTLEARAQAADGDLAAAWESVDTAYRLGGLLIGGQTLIEQLVGATITNVAAQEMRSLLHTFQDDLTPDRFESLLAGSPLSRPPVPIQPNYSGERLMFDDVVQYVFTDDGAGNGRLIPQQYAKLSVLTKGDTSKRPAGAGQDAYYLAVAALHADRRATMAKYREIWSKMIERLALPLHDPRRAEYLEPLEKLKADPVQRQRYALVVALLADLGRADLLIREAAMNQAATRALLGLLRYRAGHGHFPPSLARLVPAYLSAPPEDIYSGIPLRYSVSESGRMMLYSLGRNRQDDGGSAAETDDGPADLVYWPAAES